MASLCDARASSVASSRRGYRDTDGESLLSTSECQAIADLDPSLSDGYRLVYDREVPFELRIQSSTQREVGNLEGIKVRVLTEHTGEAMRVELLSETDLFFCYSCTVTEAGYDALRQDQKLTCPYQ
eukprot:Sspe_Gene.2120::Locus_701_Transcript_1_1_Confidence_1.000_Length_1777::g.2120::m.2120